MVTDDPAGERPGDADMAAVGALLADPGRARVLLALADGRALPASTLAKEAGVTPATASSHLAKLLEGGLLVVARHGRYRYYSLAGPAVGELIEAVARLAPSLQVTSLKEGTKAHAVRLARRCYDHLAGRLGVAVTATLVERGYLGGHDGSVDLDRMPGTRPAGGVLDPVAYVLTDDGHTALGELGVAVPDGTVVRCCVDWSEQRHHVAGPLGRALLDRVTELGWLRGSRRSRELRLTDAGRTGFTALGVRLPAG
jgi:DNA-binding transcriptional ArsR family regulator